MNKQQRRKKRKELLKELEYYTSYYKEVSLRSIQLKDFYDEQIQRIVQILKELGHR